MADKYWISNTDSTWNTAANWNTAADGTGTTGVPASTDNVHFGHATTLGADLGNGACSLDQDETVVQFTSYEGYNSVSFSGVVSFTTLINSIDFGGIDPKELGFRVGMRIVVTNSTSNNGTHPITSITSTAVIVSTSLTTENDVDCDIDYTTYLDLDGNDLTLTTSGGTGILMTLDSVIKSSSSAARVVFSGGSYVSGSGSRYFLAGDNQNFEDKDDITMVFTDPPANMYFDDGHYPIVLLDGGDYTADYAAPTSSIHGKTYFHKYSEDGSTVDVVWSSGSGTKRQNIKKQFEVSNVTGFDLATSDWDLGQSTWTFDTNDSNLKLPVNGDTDNYGDAFNVRWYNLVIKNSSGTSSRKATIPARKTLAVNSLTIEAGANLEGYKTQQPIGKDEAGASIVTSTTRPTIKGSWNFTQIADGIYSSLLSETYPITPSHGGEKMLQFSYDGGAFHSHNKILLDASNWTTSNAKLMLKNGAFVDSGSYQLNKTYAAASGSGTNNTIWQSNDTPSVLYYTDSAGTHHDLLAGGGGGLTGSGAANQVAVWSGTSSLTGSADLTFVDSGGVQTFQVSGSEPKLAVQDNTAGVTAARITLDPSVPDGTGGLAMFWGVANSPELYLKLGAFAGANNLDTKNRDFRIFGATGNLMTMDESASNTAVGKIFGLSNSADSLPLPTRTLDVGDEESSANSVLNILGLTRQTTGTPAVGIGVGMDFVVETSASNNEIGATIEAVTTDVGSGTEDFDMTFNLMAGGATAAEKMRIGSDGAIKFNDAYSFPTADGSANQFLQTDGAGNLSFVTGSGGGASALDDLTDVSITSVDETQILRYDGTEWVNEYNDIFWLRVKAREAISKGDALYIFDAHNSNAVGVKKARADSASTMPCIGVAYETLALGDEGLAISFGKANGIAANFTEGDTMYVSPTTAGGLTNTKPTDETHLIQNVGVLMQAHASNAVVKVTGIGRTNDIPNYLTFQSGAPTPAPTNTDVHVGYGNQYTDTLSIRTQYGYLNLGARNASFCHFYTDKSYFYFNKPLQFDGGDGVYAYNGDFWVKTDDASTGQVERMTIKGAQDDTRVGIAQTSPQTELDVSGTIRQTNVTSAIVHADTNGDLGALTVGTGLSLVGSTLSATGGGGGSSGMPLFSHDKGGASATTKFSPFNLFANNEKIALYTTSEPISVFTPEASSSTIQADINDIGTVSANCGMEYLFYGQHDDSALTKYRAVNSGVGALSTPLYFVRSMQEIVLASSGTPFRGNSELQIYGERGNSKTGAYAANCVRVVDTGTHSVLNASSNGGVEEPDTASDVRILLLTGTPYTESARGIGCKIVS